MPDLDQFRRTNKGGENDGVYAEFFVAAKQNQHLSLKAGRPIFEDKEMVRIVLSSDNKTELVREALPRDKARFERQYEAFKRKTDQISANGTPLSQWPVMTPALVSNFAVAGIYTVEQLAQMSDSGIQAAGMGAREWSGRAKSYLDRAESGSEALRLVHENERLVAENESLRRQMDALARRLENVLDSEGEAPPEPRRRGRPPKQQDAFLQETQPQPMSAPAMPTVI
jgi:hypothetical protein